jgi:hypothetical protein
MLDGGFHSYANVIRGFGAPFTQDFLIRADYDCSTVSSASVDAQPEFINMINMIAQHSKLFFNSVQLNYDISE